MNEFKPPGFYESLYRKPVQNKDSYGNDSVTIKNESPTRIDQHTDELIYLGWGILGEIESEPKWKIKKVEYENGVWTQKYADGNMLYDNIWSNRIDLNYK